MIVPDYVQIGEQALSSRLPVSFAVVALANEGNAFAARGKVER